MSRQYPGSRLRRTRAQEFSRRLVREHVLTPDDLIYPMFVIEGNAQRVPVASMPGIERLTIDELVRDAARAASLGIPAVALFPNVASSLRTAGGEEAFNPEGLVPRAVRAIKAGRDHRCGS
jgi:porphobilinogen synthase